MVELVEKDAPLEDLDGFCVLCRLVEEPAWRFRTGGGRGYLVEISKAFPRWELHLMDLVHFYGGGGCRVALAADPSDFAAAQTAYAGHSCRDRFLRPGEPSVLTHSTPPESWASIRTDGCLKSWDLLRSEGRLREAAPIGAALGDPAGLRDYVMLSGTSAAGEIVVLSRQRGTLAYDEHAPYRPGARLYFDAAALAHDGLLIRDGCHIKVRDRLPLEPYLLWTATGAALCGGDGVSTPAAFSALADRQFAAFRNAGGKE